VGPAFAFGSRCAVQNKLKTGHPAVALREFPGSGRTEPAQAPRRGSKNRPPESYKVEIFPEPPTELIHEVAPKRCSHEGVH
jgi:hypothetical protein